MSWKERTTAATPPQTASRSPTQGAVGAPRKRSLRFDRHRRGVSEVIGTILILALTVVLFSAIFYFVSTLPSPPGNSTSQFQAILGNSGSTNPTESYINVTYLAGPILNSAAISIYLSSSAHASNYACTRPTGSLYGNPYTIDQGLPGGATLWSAGSVWTLHLALTSGVGSPQTVCPGGNLAAAGDNVTISIVNTVQNILLFHVTLPGTNPHLPPIFTNYGVSQPGTGGTTQSYTIYTDIKSSDLNYGSVFALIGSVPGAPSAAQPMACTSCVAGQGQWTLTVPGGTTSPICCTPYSFVIMAKDNASQRNSVVLYYTFPSPANTASLLISLQLSVGNPIVGQNILLTADVGNNGGAPASTVTVTFSSNSGGTIGSSAPFATIPTGIPVPNPTYQAYIYWKAGYGRAGAHDGAVILNATATSASGSTVSTSVNVTVFPRTLVIDEDGVAQGQNSSLDTYTYLATDLNSADIPYNTTTVVPGSSVIGWNCAAPTCLNNYDVVIWLLSNTGYLGTSDQSALQSAITGGVGVWLLGAGAGVGITSGLQTDLGINHVTAKTFTVGSPTIAISPAVGNVPITGISTTNLYLDGYLPAQSQAGSLFTQFNYYTITPLASGRPFLQSNAGGNPALAISSTNSGNSIYMPMELASVAAQMPATSTNYVTSLGNQASIAYDAFNWLAGFTSLTPIRSGNDWAVSEVDVQPSTLTFNSLAYVNFTVRDNGPSTATITAELLVDNLPVFVGGNPVGIQVTPAALGGSVSASLSWTPPFIGYLTIGVEINPPPSDLDAQNNIMQNSLFSQQLYVHYNVLLVDATGSTGGVCGSSICHETTPYIYNALLSTGYPASTITQVTLSGTNGCGYLPSAISSSLTISPPRYNLVVWNAGDTINGTAACPLSIQNTNLLTTFLDNGGSSSSLLYIGNGLLTDNKDQNAMTFANNFLGLGITNTNNVSTLTPSGPIYGSTGDPMGNGVMLPYTTPVPLAAGNDSFTQVSNPVNTVTSFSLYFNDQDYWSVPATPSGAAADAYSSAAGWHTGFWGFNVGTVNGQAGGPGTIALTLLRFSTFAGRLLPYADAVVDVPDITFATMQQPWTNFDQMNPQLQQQYLIRANVTNLGGASAFSVGVQVFDGSHILGSSSVTVAASSIAPGGRTSMGVAQISVPWTPLYGWSNAIKVVITTTSTATILPGVSQIAQWQVTVYFFYDNTQNNQNQWTHDQLILWQDPVNSVSATCGAPPIGQQIYYSDDSNIANQWPQSSACAPPYSNTYAYGSGEKWGMDFNGLKSAHFTSSIACYSAQWACGSLAIPDDETHTGHNFATATSTFTIPVGVTSAIASWWQYYDLASFESGGQICVQDLTAGTQSCNVSPAPGYTGTVQFSGGGCGLVSVFTGDVPGNTWQFEQLNLSPYIAPGDSGQVVFNFLEGNVCAGTSVTAQLGWAIDQFKVRVTGGLGSAGSYDPPPDEWNLVQWPGGGGTYQGFSAPPSPGSGAWVTGYPVGSTMGLDADMWDSLYTRPIDLSNAANATMTFSYIWSRNPGNGDPPEGLVLDATPVLPNGQTEWVQVWTANTNPTPYQTTWQFSGRVNLAGYLGDVVRLRFLVGTNNGDCDEAGDTCFSFPDTPGTAMISGVEVQGQTTLSAAVVAGSLSASSLPALPSGSALPQMGTPGLPAVTALHISPRQPAPGAASSGAVGFGLGLWGITTPTGPVMAAARWTSLA